MDRCLTGGRPRRERSTTTTYRDVSSGGEEDEAEFDSITHDEVEVEEREEGEVVEMEEGDSSEYASCSGDRSDSSEDSSEDDAEVLEEEEDDLLDHIGR